MAYQATVLADSICRAGYRLTTLQVDIPRVVLAELNTHRDFSRNSASSRAIPVAKQIKALLTEPFVPDEFGINRSGMQSSAILEGSRYAEADRIWRLGRTRAVATTLELLMGSEHFYRHFGMTSENQVPTIDQITTWLSHNASWLNLLATGKLPDEEAASVLNVHKQLANRLLEPYMWHTVIVTATEWSNFFALRTHQDSQRQIRLAAVAMEDAYASSTPELLRAGQWHLPLIQPDEMADARIHPTYWRQVSAGRVARVSYKTHQGAARDPEKDVQRCQSLVADGHMSPLEHVATPLRWPRWPLSARSGNFRGWKQYRKLIPHEDDYGRILAAAAVAEMAEAA